MDLATIGSIGGWVIGGGFAAVTAFRKGMAAFKGDGITLTTTDAMGGMAELLAGQIKELADTNVQLRQEIKALRESNSQLMIQNLHLQEEVEKLAIKVQELTASQ